MLGAADCTASRAGERTEEAGATNLASGHALLAARVPQGDAASRGNWGGHTAAARSHSHPKHEPRPVPAPGATQLRNQQPTCARSSWRPSLPTHRMSPSRCRSSSQPAQRDASPARKPPAFAWRSPQRRPARHFRAISRLRWARVGSRA